MDADDLLVGRFVSRRDAVRLLATAGAVTLAGCGGGRPSADGSTDTAAGAAGSAVASTPTCVARPELTVGPYFLDQQLERSDIRSEPSTGAVRDGVPLTLDFNVSRIDRGECAPLAGAVVDVWQCDAEGRYSGVADRQIGFDTTGQKFLRGYLRTDPSGMARFVAIYPGWYSGRTVHIHFKIRTESAPNTAYEFTSQLFFPDSVTDQVHARAPYAAKGRRDLTNADDGSYRQAGDTLLLAVAPSADGHKASFSAGLDLANAEVGQPERSGGPGGPGGPPPGGGPPGARHPPPPRPPGPSA